MSNFDAHTQSAPSGPRPSGDEASVTASVDPARGEIAAAVHIYAPPERVFRALTSDEICNWWVRPGVFDTRRWKGDLSVGGGWKAEGVGNGRPYGLEGEFVEIEHARKLVHTWKAVGAPGTPSTVTYLLEKLPQGTRLTLHHTGLAMPEICANTYEGWRTSLQRLAERLAKEPTHG